MRNREFYVIALVVISLVLTAALFGQSAATTSTANSIPIAPKAVGGKQVDLDLELTTLKLHTETMRGLNKDYQLSQDAYMKVQQELSSKWATQNTETNDLVEKIKKEQGWGSDVYYDRDKDAWFKKPAETKTPEQTKKR